MNQNLLAHYLFLSLAVAVGAKIAYDWCRELVFYKKNGWDFSQESGLDKLKAGGFRGVKRKTMSNKLRLILAYPITLFFVAAFILVMSLTIFN